MGDKCNSEINTYEAQNYLYITIESCGNIKINFSRN